MSHSACQHERYLRDDLDVIDDRAPQRIYGSYDKHRRMRADARESSKILWHMWRRPSPVQDVEQIFNTLAERWYEDTAHLSSIQKIVMHPAYQQIVGLGKKAVPLILRSMQNKPGYWFWALEAITRQNPVTPEVSRSVRASKRAWIEWGKQEGYV